jgi:hypothetical protein
MNKGEGGGDASMRFPALKAGRLQTLQDKSPMLNSWEETTSRQTSAGDKEAEKAGDQETDGGRRTALLERGGGWGAWVCGGSRG